MKRRILRNIGKSFIPVNLIAAALLLSMQANATVGSEKAETAKVQVKFTGNSNDALIFTVKYDNPSGNKFDVEFVDEDGQSLYLSTFNDKTFEKKFSIPKAAFSKISIIVKGDTTEKFDIKIESKQVDNVIINKQ